MIENDARVRRGTVVISVGLALNFLLFAAKIAVGILFGLVSVIADAFNNLSDAGTSAVSLVGLRLSSKPVDKGHPYGHGRFEYIAAFAVSAVVVFVGAELAYSSVRLIFSPVESSFGLAVYAVLAVSVAVKAAMFVWYKVMSKRVDSEALRASSIDSLSDAVATAAVLICAVIARFTGLVLDGYAGVAVSAFIIASGVVSLKRTIDDLIGPHPDKKHTDEIQSVVRSFPEVKGMHDLEIHSYGHGREHISLHIELSSSLGFVAAHAVSDAVERALSEHFDAKAVVHADPIFEDDERVAYYTRLALEAASSVCPGSTVHDLRIVSGVKKDRVVFDAVIPYNYKNERIISHSIEQKVESVADCYCTVNVDRPL